ncbi:MAG: stage II sporulation protein M [bacterium]|nr:stage II sporulation protein M [bacterium]
MNKTIYNAKNMLIKQKKIYVFLITLILIGIISGIVFIFFLNKADKTTVISNVETFFNQVKIKGGINYSKSILNTTLSNIIYILLLWLLGISVIGFPIIIGILFIKSFILGFSISSIILTYGFKGVLYAFLYVFPHHIIFIIIILLLSFYSLSFCYKLFNHLFLKKFISFRNSMNKYIKILIICLVSSLVLSAYEVFISTYFIKLFTLLIK